MIKFLIKDIPLGLRQTSKFKVKSIIKCNSNTYGITGGTFCILPFLGRIISLALPRTSLYRVLLFRASTVNPVDFLTPRGSTLGNS